MCVIIIKLSQILSLNYFDWKIETGCYEMYEEISEWQDRGKMHIYIYTYIQNHS